MTLPGNEHARVQGLRSRARLLVAFACTLAVPVDPCCAQPHAAVVRGWRAEQVRRLTTACHSMFGEQYMKTHIDAVCVPYLGDGYGEIIPRYGSDGMAFAPGTSDEERATPASRA